MNVVLLSAGPKIASQPVAEASLELRASGASVTLVMWAAPSRALLESVDSAAILGPLKVEREEPAPHTEVLGSVDAADFGDSTDTEVSPEQPDAQAVEATTAQAKAKPRGFGRERLRAALRWRLLRYRKRLRPYRRLLSRALRKAKRHPQRTWRALRRDDSVQRMVRDADVLIAMDSQAILAAWKLSRRMPRAEVVYGLSSGSAVVKRRLQAGEVQGAASA